MKLRLHKRQVFSRSSGGNRFFCMCGGPLTVADTVEIGKILECRACRTQWTVTVRQQDRRIVALECEKVTYAI